MLAWRLGVSRVGVLVGHPKHPSYRTHAAALDGPFKGTNYRCCYCFSGCASAAAPLRVVAAVSREISDSGFPETPKPLN